MTSDPDSTGEPTSPAQITRPSWRYLLRRTVHEFLRDECTDSAAVMTFFAVLSIFPGLLTVVSMLGVFGQTELTIAALLGLLEEIGTPDEVVALLEEPISELAGFPSAGLALALSLLGALWTASGYVRALARSMNRIYEVQEGRPAWKLYPVMIGVTLSLMVLVAGMILLLLVSGPVARRLGELFGLGETALLISDGARIPVLLLLFAFIVTLLYYATPNVRQPTFRWLSIGSLFAIAVTALATTGFSFYVSNFNDYDATYGAISGVIVLLLWMWIVNIVLLAGAELNAEIERARQLQAGLPAEETLQLSSRDTRQTTKVRKRDQDMVDQGRRLRQIHAQSS